MCECYPHIFKCLQSSISPSLPSSSLTFEYIRGGIMRELIICGEGTLWSFDNDITGEWQRKGAGPASFTEKLFTQGTLAKSWWWWWCQWWVERTSTTTISAGAPSMISSERTDLERVGHGSRLAEYHCQNSTISWLQQDDLVYRGSGHKAGTPRNKYILALSSFYIRSCFTDWYYWHYLTPRVFSLCPISRLILCLGSFLASQAFLKDSLIYYFSIRTLRQHVIFIYSSHRGKLDNFPLVSSKGTLEPNCLNSHPSSCC